MKPYCMKNEPPEVEECIFVIGDFFPNVLLNPPQNTPKQNPRFFAFLSNMMT